MRAIWRIRTSHVAASWPVKGSQTALSPAWSVADVQAYSAHSAPGSARTFVTPAADNSRKHAYFINIDHTRTRVNPVPYLSSSTSETWTRPPGHPRPGSQNQ